MAVFFLDNDQKVIKIVPNDGAISILQTQELPESDGLLKDTLYVRLKNDQRLFDAQYMAVKSYGDNRNAFDLYRIVNEIVPDNATEFEGVQLAPYELEGTVIEDLRPQYRPLDRTVNQLLEDTDWRLGYMDDNLPTVSTNFYYVSVKDALKQLQDLLNIEFLFKVEISGNEITDKWVEVYREVGNRTLKRFNYGTNALTVKRETSSNELYTALIGRGKGEEVSSAEDNPGGQAGYGRKINFADVEWSRENGDPVDKPKGQKYIDLPQATEEYGIKLIDGRKVPRVGIVEFPDTEEPEVLINQTWQELQYYARPRVLFSTTVAKIGDTGIGDTVTIHRHDLNMHYMTRVRKVVRNRKNDKQTQLEIGDVVHTPSTKRQSNINSALNNVASDLDNVRGEITEARSSADGKNTNNYGNVEPDRKKVGDTWFRDHPSLTGESQILVWNGEAWELIMDTSDTTKNADAIKEQQKEIEEAKQTADEALSEIDVAIRNAGFTSLDDTIKSVQSRANIAFDTASDLIGEVSGYSQTVDGFNQTVNDYEDQVANFQSDVNGFASTVAQYSSAVSGYATQVSTLSNEVSGFNSTVANIDGRVSTLSNTVDGLSSTVSGHGNRISAVEQTASGLQTTVATKANQSQVTQLSNAFNVYIEDASNLIHNPYFAGGLSDSWTIDQINNADKSDDIPREWYATHQKRDIYNTKEFAVRPGEIIELSLYAWGSAGSTALNIGLIYYDKNKEHLTWSTGGGRTTRGYITARMHIPENARFARFWIQQPLTSDFRTWWFTDAKATRSASHAQLSVLNDNINLRVAKGDVLSQINIEAERTLIESNKLLLNADNTVITGTAWMDGAVIANASIDGAKIADATIGSAKIASLDVSKLSGNISNFVQTNWNSATGGSVSATGDGIVTTASNNSQTLIQNGVTLTRNPRGATIGSIGYVYDDGSPTYMVTATNGAHFKVRSYQHDSFAILANGIDGYLRTNRFEFRGDGGVHFYNAPVLHTRINMNNQRIVNSSRITFYNGGYIESQISTSNMRLIASNQFRVETGGGSLAYYIDNSHVYMSRILNMGGHTITNQSDYRLKRDIMDTTLDSLGAIESWRMVDFNWKDSELNERNGRQLGLIAQNTPEIAMYDAKNDIWSINSSKQIMLNSHAIQQLAIRESNTNKIAEANEEKIHKLQQELSKANRRIEELEGVI